MAEKEFIPIAAHFDLTYRCNLRCIHCYIPESSRYPSVSCEEELTAKEIYYILDQLSECKTLFINFSGGEIFTRHDTLDIIEYARGKKFHVSLMTTGTIGFNEYMVNRIADIGIRVVDISIYSTESEIHDSITGVPGSFYRTIKAVELLNERGVKIRLKCPLMKKNIGTFRGVIELAKFYGIYYAFDPNITSSGDGDKRPLYLRLSDEDLSDYYAYDIQVSGDRGAVEMHPPLCDEKLSEGPCGGGRFSCYISPCGDVQPCVEINMICGNLKEKPFKWIWDNSEEMLMVRAIQRKDLRNCADCPKPDFCFRCMGQSYRESGDLLAPVEEFCRMAKVRHRVTEEVSLSG